MKNKHCNGCPINIHTEEGETVSNYGLVKEKIEVKKVYE
jgi:hypothetical protein